MSHRDKIICSGAFYHITQRAPGEQLLFKEEDDRTSFLRMLKVYSKKYDLDILCFCLMSNHLHILVRINYPNLSEAMKSLFTTYAVNFNNKYERKGHVFGGVYRAAICLDDAHLLTASFYIHANPLVAGIIDECSKYRWSSMNLYSKDNVFSFVKTNVILEKLDDDFEKSVLLYKEMLSDYINIKKESANDEAEYIFKAAKLNINNIKRNVKSDRFNIDYIFSEKCFDERIKAFCSDSKYSRNLAKRDEFIDICKELNSRGFTLKEIADKLNVSRPTMYKIYKSLHIKVEP